MSHRSIRSRVKRAAAALVSLLTFVGLEVQPVVAATTGLHGQLNLSSTTHSVGAPGSLTSPVSIVVGGHRQTVAPGSLLTPAEAVAVQQVLSSGRQTIVLGTYGNATGGSLILPSQQALSSLVVPRGVTAVRDFAPSQMSLTGNFTNAGRFYAVSTDAGMTNAMISALGISNLRGGLLTTVLPMGGLPGFSNAISNLSLTLASRRLLNAGTISSAGDLNLIGTSNSYVVRGLGGTFSAANAINVNGTGAAHSNNWLLGGNWLSNVFNADAGKGNILVNVNQLTGVVNILNACNAHVFANTADLQLGTMNITGDPTFYNTSTIDLTVSGPLVFAGQAIAVVSGQDINLNGQAISSASGTGGSISLIAGAAVASVPSQTFPNQISSGTLKITGASGTGGNITNGGAATSIDSSSSSATSPGGNILLAAFASGGSGGQINLSNVTLNSSNSNATPAAKAGDITIIANGPLTLGSAATPAIIATGLSGAKITITTAQPTGTITFDSTGKITASTLKAGTLNMSGTGNILFNGLITAPGAIINATAGNQIEVNNTINVSGANLGQSGGSVTLTTMMSNVLLSNTAPGAIFADGANGVTGATGLAGGAGGAGGSIIISAGGAITDVSTATTLSANGGIGGTGGAGAAATVLNGNAGGAGGVGGAGGTISLTGTTAVNLETFPGSTVTANGGNGGVGGAGSNGLNMAGMPGGNGGNGGIGGAGGKGGSVTLKTTAGDVTSTTINAIGGIGGQGGTAGTGGTSTTVAAGAAGTTGAGGAGGAGGTLTMAGPLAAM